jgi:hypothetical protein
MLTHRQFVRALIIAVAAVVLELSCTEVAAMTPRPEPQIYSYTSLRFAIVMTNTVTNGSLMA